MRILILNAGSSSLKYKVFDADNKGEMTVVLHGIIEAIGESQSAWHHNEEKQVLPVSNHFEAMKLLSEKIADEINEPIAVVGHRVVHGGTSFSKPTLISDEVVAKLHQLTSLAPLHNPANIACIELARAQFQTIAHIAFFDTAFHQSMPDYAYHYAIDNTVAQQYAIRRYGFHGTNHEYVAEQAAMFIEKPLDRCQFISLHLGNGASACLIKNGKSQDTSMGMTPLAGLMMGTRCGDIDASISYYLQNQGMSLDEIDELYNKRSGLKGICGVNDMREVEHLAATGDKKAQLALTMFCYRIQQYIGFYYSQAPNLDGVIFTGGIGENSIQVRQRVVQNLDHLGLTIDEKLNSQRRSQRVTSVAKGKCEILVITGDEELHMARQCLRF